MSKKKKIRGKFNSKKVNKKEKLKKKKGIKKNKTKRTQKMLIQMIVLLAKIKNQTTQ